MSQPCHNGLPTRTAPTSDEGSPVPISPMDEFLAHQTTDTFDYVFTSDRNFYDRYYFNCHPSSDELFLVAGMGQYPNLGVTDAFVSISHGTHQYTVRASRELGSDRLDTRVGPLSVEVVEGLRSLRVRCEPNEWGVAFDLLFEGSVPALEEPKSFNRSHARITQDVSRYAQVGTWRGALEVARRHYDVDPARWQGARDHSWGVRPVGEPEAPGIRLKDMQRATVGLFHHWLPMQFADHMIKVSIDEDYAGNRMQEESVKIWNFGIDKPREPMGRPEVEIAYLSGTREMQHSVLTLHPPGGKPLRSANTPLRTVYLAAGSGYRPDAEWGHGTWRGEQVVQGLVHDMSTAELRRPWAFLNETLCRFELDTGEVGYGMHENLCIGIHRPSGFDTPDAVAP
jgi:hypothetical protein